MDGRTAKRQAVVFVYLSEGAAASERLPAELWKSLRTAEGTETFKRTCDLLGITCAFSVFVLRASCVMSAANSGNHGM